MKRSATAVALTFYSICLTIAVFVLLGRERALTRGEVAADRRHLAVVAARLQLEAPPEDGPALVYLTFADRCGLEMAGTVRSGWRAGDGTEARLSFRLLLEPEQRFRNPSRRPLPAATLVRDEITSILVRPREPRQLTLALLADPDGLRINNLEGHQRLPLATYAAPSLVALMPVDPTGVSCKASARDLEVAALLGELLRLAICEDVETTAGCRDVVLIGHRDRFPGSFLLSAASLGEDSGVLTLRLEVASEGGDLGRDLGGRLRRAHLEIDPRRTDLRLAATVSVVAPASGDLRPVLRYVPGAAHPEAAEIDLEALLADTAWKRAR